MSSWESRRIELVLGLAAGVATTVVTHPLDLLKVRLQLLRHRSTHAFELVGHVVRSIRADAAAAAASASSLANRPRRSLVYYLLQQWYRGVGPNLLGNAAAWSVYFALYAEYKELLVRIGSPLYFGASALAGVSTSLLTNPLWVLKTRILASPRSDASYKSMADGVRRILQEEGISTFWRGTLPSLFGVVQASIQFSLYDQLKDWIVVTSTKSLQSSQSSSSSTSSKELSAWQYIYASAILKVASMSLLYPTQVVRSRLQAQNDARDPRTIAGVCRSLWRNEGYFRGFYRGMGANIIRVLPSTCITFVTYETVKNTMRGLA